MWRKNGILAILYSVRKMVKNFNAMEFEEGQLSSVLLRRPISALLANPLSLSVFHKKPSLRTAMQLRIKR
jgi:hypothetical protein